jgi:methyl-accepting chemotaxis protein
MKSLSMNSKFVGILSIFIMASTIISVLGISKMNELNDSLNSIVSVNLPRLIMAKDMDALTGDLRDMEKTLILEPNPVEMKKISADMDHLNEKMNTGLMKMREIVTEKGKLEVDEARQRLDDWRKISNEIRELSLANKNELAFALSRSKGRELLDVFDAKMTGIVERNDKLVKEESIRTDLLYADSKNIIIIVSLVSILSGMLLAFFVLRSLNSAINSVINGLNDSSLQVTSAAQQIASSSNELAQGATEQASSLEQTSSAVEEMNSMVQKNAENAQQSLQSAQSSGETVARGQKVVAEMKKAMTEIDVANVKIMRQTNDSNTQISEIVKVIAEIGNKTKVINDIVFQTKLLSFNASVEAARAGEHGKGFAVVAEEVGNLAQMSGNAAKEITGLLESSIQKVEGIVRDTKTSVEGILNESKMKVEFGSRVADDCAVVLNEIVAKVNLVSEMSHSISTASDEQAKGVSEITLAVTQLDQMTQQNAAVSEEAASAAEELSAQAESMQNIVQLLIKTVRGGDSTQEFRSQKIAYALRAESEPMASSGKRNKVIHLSSKLPSSHSAPSNRLVSGSDIIPSENDPRFKEI